MASAYITIHPTMVILYLAKGKVLFEDRTDIADRLLVGEGIDGSESESDSESGEEEEEEGGYDR